MSYCKSCGKKLEDGTKFCRNCGVEVKEKTLIKSKKNKVIVIVGIMIICVLILNVIFTKGIPQEKITYRVTSAERMDGNDNIEANYFYEYDEANNLIYKAEEFYDITYEYEYKYDESGNCTNQFYKNSMGIEATYSYEYNSENYCTSEICSSNDNLDYEKVYEYDSIGNCVKESGKYDSGVEWKQENEYDNSGNIIRSVSITSLSLISITEYKYDDSDNCIYKKCTYDYDETDNIIDITYETMYEYDEHDNCIEENWICNEPTGKTEFLITYNYEEVKESFYWKPFNAKEYY